MSLPQIRKPYLLFLGDVPDALSAKTALGIAQWRPDWCLGQFRLPGCPVDSGVPDMTIAEARAKGAATMVIGVAPLGGELPPAWLGPVVEALEADLDVASGLHTRLADIPVIAEAAASSGRRVLDVRHPTQSLACGSGDKRSGKRLLTIGTDCCVGKMFTALAIAEEMRRRGIKADFRATGQTGIFIAGAGIAVDAVIADFISGAAERLSPANDADHWDVIEGQGALSHPSYAGVSVGLVHGAQPDALVLCHEAGRTRIDGMEQWALPSLEDCAADNLRLARLTNPEVKMVGVSMNTAAARPREAERILAEAALRLRVPCVDPVRTGVAPIVDRLP